MLGLGKNLFAYDYITTHNNTIKLNNSSFYITEEDLSPEKVYELYQQNTFNQLPKEAKSFGFDKQYYWFAFELESNDEDNFLDIINTSLFLCELNYFRDDLLSNQVKKGTITKDDRIRFSLGKSTKTTYLLKVYTKNPKFIAFGFGSEAEVEKYHNIQFSLFSFVCGVFLFTLIINFFLFARLKDKTYIYYIIHISGLFISVIITIGYASLLPIFKVPFWVLLALLMQFIGLVLFSDKFLQLYKFQKIRKIIFNTLYVSIIIGILAFFYGPLHELLFLLLFIVFGMLFYIALNIARKGSKSAQYYVLGTGITILMIATYTLTHKGLLPYTFFTFNLLQFALTWDAVFLTFAIAFRLEQLQTDNLAKEKILKLKAREETLSSMMSNVTHQWRTPLAQLGSMITTLRTKFEFSNVSKDESIYYLDNMSKQLKFLSQTVETFNNFTIENKHKIMFNLSKSIGETVSMLADDIKSANIQLNVDIKENIFIKGNENLIEQVILALLQNAKEAIIESNLSNGQIDISLKTVNEKILLLVADNGKQIEFDYKDMIFDPFFTTKKNGSGIGLYLAKKIIEENYKGKFELLVENKIKIFLCELDLKI